MKIKYTGTSDYREFSKKDLERFEVEDAKALVFPRDEPTEVPEGVGLALTDPKHPLGKEFFEEVKEEKPEPEPEPEDDVDNTSDPEVPDDGQFAIDGFGTTP